ncbi:astrotactin-2-like isoform X3 [Hypanus sabinus]|uniref:astrotactin-2-like isoform X3 n=1 Tax=Hypanus sabinus TaxID=79690 RepID=UPI0028C39BF6|nr:astrotactin-2-like isoform X3 [Hypanus sabinus]
MALRAALQAILGCLLAASAEISKEGGCKVKTVTVSTLPVLRENDISFHGVLAAESKLYLFVRNDLPGEILVADDLENTELPYFTLEMTGTVADISLVHWKQQWLENGTLYFHVSMSNAEHLSQITPPTMREASEIVDEQMHVLHVSVMGGLIALLLLILIFTMALYARRRWCKRRRVPQKSASTEATHEIHYIPSVLLGPQARDSFRNSRIQAHNSVVGMPIRETPILDDYDCEEEENQLRPEACNREDDFGSQVTRTLESLGRGEEKKPSFAGGSGILRAEEDSGTEADDETHLTFYSEHRGRRRSKGSPRSPLNRTALTLITVSSCVLTVVYGGHLTCPLMVKVTLHVPEHFIADGSSFVVSEGSFLDVSDWLNPAKLSLFYQINATSAWTRDLCGQKTLEPCEHLCDEETGECGCHDGYSPDPIHKHLCVRSDWGQNEGLVRPWPYTTLERGYDLVTGEQAPEKIFRSTYSLSQGLWLPVSKSFVVPPVELSISPLASCKTDVLVTEDTGEVREESMRSTYFETPDDLLSSFGPVRDCSRDNGGCTRNYRCVTDRKVDSTGCVCPVGLRPMRDGSGCFDHSKGIDCSDGFNGGCEQLCLQQTVPLTEDPSSTNILMFCGCVEEYRLAADGKSCLLLSESCDGPKCQKADARLNDTLFVEMLHGYNNKSQQVNQGQVFQMTFRENNFMKDFPQLADGLVVIPLPVEEQCRGVLSEPLPNLQLLTGNAKYNEATGYPMVQEWRVRSNLYKVKLNSITQSTGFSNVLKMLKGESSREDLISIIQQYGSHYIAEALYGSELTCKIHFPSKKVQQQLWLQYQKETTELGNKKIIKSIPFISYLSSLLGAQMLSDEQPITGVEIECEEKGQCPSSCHLCHRQGKDQASPTPVLLEITHIIPLYHLIEGNMTREAFKTALMSSYWCLGKGDVIDDWCRCDLSAFDEDGLPSCSPLPQPVLRLSSSVEPSSTMIGLEWQDAQPVIGTKIADYVIHYKKLDDYIDPNLYAGESLSFADDLLSGLGSSCVVVGKNHELASELTTYSLIFKCLEPDSFYKFTLYALDSRGRRSEPSAVTMRTTCQLIDDSKAEEIAERIYSLFNGYTSGKEQQAAYNMLMEISSPMVYRVIHHYNSHYEKFGDFGWRSEDELGPRKAHLIRKRLDTVSDRCASLLHSAYIQSHIDSVLYFICRMEETRPTGMVWYSTLHDAKVTCDEKLMSVPRNIYGDTKLW